MATGVSGKIQDVERRLKLLRKSRTNKKGSVTKRINGLKRFVADNGGRRATKMMIDALEKVYAELEKVCEEISLATDEDDDLNDLEDIRFNVENCVAVASEYLEATKDDPASETSSIALSWVKKHVGRFGIHEEEDLVMENDDLDDTQNLGRSRFNYSSSRPPTPRILPQIPPLDKSISVLDDEISTATRNVTPRGEDQGMLDNNTGNVNGDNTGNVKIDSTGNVNCDNTGNVKMVDTGNVNTGKYTGIVMNNPNQNQEINGSMDKVGAGGVGADGLPDYGVLVEDGKNGEGGITIPLSLSFTGDGDVRKRDPSCIMGSGNVQNKNGDLKPSELDNAGSVNGKNGLLDNAGNKDGHSDGGAAVPPKILPLSNNPKISLTNNLFPPGLQSTLAPNTSPSLVPDGDTAVVDNVVENQIGKQNQNMMEYQNGNVEYQNRNMMEYQNGNLVDYENGNEREYQNGNVNGNQIDWNQPIPEWAQGWRERFIQLRGRINNDDNQHQSIGTRQEEPHEEERRMIERPRYQEPSGHRGLDVGNARHEEPLEEERRKIGRERPRYQEPSGHRGLDVGNARHEEPLEEERRMIGRERPRYEEPPGHRGMDVVNKSTRFEEPFEEEHRRRRDVHSEAPINHEESQLRDKDHQRRFDPRNNSQIRDKEHLRNDPCTESQLRDKEHSRRIGPQAESQLRDKDQERHDPQAESQFWDKDQQRHDPQAKSQFRDKELQKTIDPRERSQILDRGLAPNVRSLSEGQHRNERRCSENLVHNDRSFNERQEESQFRNERVFNDGQVESLFQNEGSFQNDVNDQRRDSQFRNEMHLSDGSASLERLAQETRAKMNSYNLQPARSQPDDQISLAGSASSGYSSGSSSSSARHTRVHNDVDSWIDLLDVNRIQQPMNVANGGVTSNVLMASLMQQYLPKVEIPVFDGSPLMWVEFIVKFRDVVHNQPHLNDKQRNQQLIQHLRDDAKRAVKEFINDPRGYPLALKRLKYLFGQRPTVARAVLSKVTKGKPVGSKDIKGLSELYYSICDCLITLKQLNYDSDLHSSDTLFQAVQRLPSGLVLKWSERSQVIRKRHEEPSLVHLEEWLKDRVLAQREADLSLQQHVKKREKDERSHIGVQLEGDRKCDLCNGSHSFWKCQKYKDMKPTEKMDVVRKLKICFNCFRESHTRQECSSKNRCFHSGCGKKHHTTLHEYYSTEKERNRRRRGKKDDKEKKDENNEDNAEDEAVLNGLNISVEMFTAEVQMTSSGSPPETPDETGAVTRVNFCSTEAPRKTVILLVVAVTIHIDGKCFDTFALLDDGSQSTLLRREFFDKMGVTGRPKQLLEATVKDDPQPVTVDELSMVVSHRDGSNRLNLKSVYVQPADMFNMPSRPRLESSNVKKYPHLKGLEFDAVKAEDINLLIGSNVPKAHLYDAARVGGDDDPVAVKTRFGWTVYGPSTHNYDRDLDVEQCSTMLTDEYFDQAVPCLWDEDETPPIVFTNQLTVSSADESLQNQVEKFWKQEHCGILPPKDIAMSVEDKEAMEKLEKETRLIDNRYEVPMLWAKPDTRLPQNISMATRRFIPLLRKLRANPEFNEKSQAVIKGYFEAKPPQARKMTSAEANKVSPKTWMLPIHPVTNPNKPGKVRLTNDAAAEYGGVSLNKSLLTGPDLLNSLVGVLMRFRVDEVAIAADIEAMFHQVRVNSEDADSLRFLWKEDITSDDPPDVCQMLVHIFGAKSSPTCANYAVQRTARDNREHFDALVLYAALRSFYVDDLLKSVGSEETAIVLAQQLTEMLKRGGFRLCKFISNRPSVLAGLPPEDVSPSSAVKIDAEGENASRALGISWETKADVFKFSAQFDEDSATKRVVLRISSSLFDPLGFLTPFILKAKILLQALWRLNCGWDDEFDGPLKDRWLKWLKNAETLSNMRLNRTYITVGDRRITAVQLHVFCDASEVAYGAVAYARYCFKDGSYECSLVMAKSRVAPVKTVTLPRLELDAARCGARLARLIVHELDLPIEQVKYWSDSTLTLQYVKNRRHRMKSRVANRVTEILESSDPEDWEHVPGHINPADLLTRGVSKPEKLMTSRWFLGPEFLEKNEDEWPQQQIQELDDGDLEVKRRALFTGVALIEVGDVNISRISSWRRLLRVAAYVLRFIYLTRTNEEEKRLDNSFSVEEIKDAEQMVLKDVQKSAFQEEIRALQKSKAIANTSQLAGLSPFVDSTGTMRVGGRLRRLQLDPDAKHPIILPRQAQETKLLVEHIHRRNGHVGPEHVLSLVREKYWVIGGRIVTNQVLAKCFFCRVRRAKRQFPYMADLPECRAAVDQPPFSHCGVDLFGPVTIKQGRKELKRWVVLLTCLTVRCVHLEVVNSCETDDFISALRRFTNRRGCPTDMYSDNGSNFKGATNELKEFVSKLDKGAIEEFATDLRIEWHWNPPSAPHMGGAWERLVRSSKEVLCGLVQKKVLTDSQLITFLTEVERILNSRPLTHISENIDDLDALTPNHILLGRHRNWHTITDISESDITSRKKWKQVQALQVSFWQRWVKEYLPTLMKRPCWRTQKPNFVEGELVLVQDDDFKRGKWPLGRITKVMPGADDVVRMVQVKMKNATYTRPVSKLYKLEDTGDFVKGGRMLPGSSVHEH